MSYEEIGGHLSVSKQRIHTMIRDVIVLNHAARHRFPTDLEDSLANAFKATGRPRAAYQSWIWNLLDDALRGRPREPGKGPSLTAGEQSSPPVDSK
jgi:hypothetical protein